MKTVKVYIATGPELEEARRAVDDVLELLNRHFRARGVEFVAAAQGEGPESGDWTIALWWKEFGAMGRVAFENACEELKTRKRPAKMYVFFKEPDEGIAEELKRFKESFATRHGPFHGRFETVDAVRFQLAAQSLSLLPGGGNGPGEREMLSVEDGDVRLEGERVAKMENLPFAKLNDRRKMLLQQIAAMENEVSSLEAGAAASPGDEDILRPLRDARNMCRQLKEDLKQYDGYLLNMAVSFAKSAGEELDERVAKARELFERGKVRAANKELDLNELVESSGQTLPTFEAQRELGAKNIQALLAKAEMVLADDSLAREERVGAACKAHEESIRLARRLRVPDRQVAEMMWNYAYFLQQQTRLQASGRWYSEALECYRLFSKVDALNYLPLVAATLNNLANLHSGTQRLVEAESEYREALEIRRRLAEGSPEAYEPDVAMTLGNYAILMREEGNKKEARRLAAEALELYQRCESRSPGQFAAKIEWINGIVVGEAGQRELPLGMYEVEGWGDAPMDGGGGDGQTFHEEVAEYRDERGGETSRSMNPGKNKWKHKWWIVAGLSIVLYALWRMM